MSVYDMLGIDENAGIDASEIEAIKATLDRIKVVAAGVAKDNDTTDTLNILKEVERTVRRVVSSGIHSIDELHQQFGTYGTTGGGVNTAAPRALGAGTNNPADETALRHVLGSSSLDQGRQLGMIRIAANDGEPDQIKVDSNGTPIVIAAMQAQIRRLEQEKAAAEAAKTAAEQALANAQQNPAPAGDAAERTRLREAVRSAEDYLARAAAAVGRLKVKWGSAQEEQRDLVAVLHNAKEDVHNKANGIQTPDDLGLHN